MEIKAFKAYRFNKQVVKEPGSCISPPYDVIDAEKQEKLYNSNDYNIVRAIKGKTKPADNDNENVYTRANDYLTNAIAENALIQDEKPAIYSYVQNFTIADQPFQRSGFIALGGLTEFGDRVKPHEKTLDGPKADRLKLMTATKSQFGQIFMLFDDPKKIADEIIDNSIRDNPLLDYTDDENVRHRLFAITDTDDINAIADMMSDKDAVIADGHHRYETALNYYKQSGNPDAKYRMMTFVNMHNDGLVILGTHRLIGDLQNFDIKQLIEKLDESFTIEKFTIDQKDKMFDAMRENFENSKISFGLYANDDAFYCITLTDDGIMDKLAPAVSDASKKLDVSVLHTVILDNILGIGEKQLASQSNIEYIKDIGNAIDTSIARVNSGEKQAVFFMNPTRIEQVRQVAAEGEKMPQKSTFFHPKIFTGLTINKL